MRATKLLRAAAALLTLALLLLVGVRPAVARGVADTPHCCCPPSAHGADHASAARAELHKTCACAIAPHEGPRTTPPPIATTAPTARDALALPAPTPHVLAVVARPSSFAPRVRVPWTPPPRSLHALRTLFTV